MTALMLTVLATSIPLLLAATGELVAERSGVLNLGVEGMMLIGAVAALSAADDKLQVKTRVLRSGDVAMLCDTRRLSRCALTRPTTG